MTNPIPRLLGNTPRPPNDGPRWSGQNELPNPLELVLPLHCVDGEDEVQFMGTIVATPSSHEKRVRDAGRWCSKTGCH